MKRSKNIELFPNASIDSVNAKTAKIHYFVKSKYLLCKYQNQNLYIDPRFLLNFVPHLKQLHVEACKIVSTFDLKLIILLKKIIQLPRRMLAKQRQNSKFDLPLHRKVLTFEFFYMMKR